MNRPAADLGALGDALRRDLAHPAARAAGFAAREAYARAAPAENGKGWIAGYSPGVATIGVGLATELLMRCLAHVADHGGGDVTLWREGAVPDDDRAARGAGLDVDRELLQMRVTLPLAVSGDDELPPTVTVRTFVPGSDDDAWIAVNNRAFAGHAEQGDWDRTTLAARRREPWFDASMFLLAIEAGRIIGFNWLRCHAPTDREPEAGEIYAIGVDPDAQGRGLGRALATAGLARLEARGIRQGLLYVAADNAGAIELYRSIGFAVTRTDRAYAARVVPE